MPWNIGDGLSQGLCLRASECKADDHCTPRVSCPDRSFADGAERGLADSRLRDVLAERVLPQLAAASLARLRATCSSMHALLDSGLSHAAWQSASQQLPHGRRAQTAQQQHVEPGLPSTGQQKCDSPPHQQQGQQQLQQQQGQGHMEDLVPGVSSTADDKAGHQPDGHLQQELAANTPTAEALQEASSVTVQQQLRQLADTLRKLRAGGKVMLKPLHAKAVMRSAKWSSCGRWVALEQLLPSSQLVIWDTQCNTSQELTILPHGRFLKLAWLPASAWLLYVKTHTAGHEFSKQSIFCQNMASGEKHELLERPHRHWHGKHVPVVAPSGHVMAYVHSVCVVLLQLPSLRHYGTLSPTIPSRSNVTTMSFNPAATQLAVCWEANALGGADSEAFCLDIFDVVSKCRVFSLPCTSSVKVTWAPTSAHLLISTVSAVSLLNMSSLDLIGLPIHATDWFPAFALQEALWSVNVELALVRGASHLVQGKSLCFAIRPDGSIAYQWSSNFHACAAHPVRCPILPDRQTPCLMDDPALIHDLDLQSLRGEDSPLLSVGPGAKVCLSRCGCLAVTLPERHWNPTQDSRHCEVSAIGAIDWVQYLPLPGVEMRAAFSWHPLQTLSCVYAVAGKDHDLYLVDGHVHKVLRRWSGSALLASQQVSPGVHSWLTISWSEDGEKLRLRCSCAVLVIDMQSDTSQPLAQLPAKAAKPTSLQKPWKALQQFFMRRQKRPAP